MAKELGSTVRQNNDSSIGIIIITIMMLSMMIFMMTITMMITMMLTGWGTTEFEGDYSDLLQEVKVPIVTDSVCSKGRDL